MHQLARLVGQQTSRVLLFLPTFQFLSYTPTHPAFLVLGIKFRPSSLYSNHSDDWAISPAPWIRKKYIYCVYVWEGMNTSVQGCECQRVCTSMWLCVHTWMFLSVCALLCVCVCTCVSIYVCMCASVCSEYICGRYSIGQRKASDVLLSLPASFLWGGGLLLKLEQLPTILLWLPSHSPEVMGMKGYTQGLVWFGLNTVNNPLRIPCNLFWGYAKPILPPSFSQTQFHPNFMSFLIFILI